MHTLLDFSLASLVHFASLYDIGLSSTASISIHHVGSIDLARRFGGSISGLTLRAGAASLTNSWLFFYLLVFLVIWCTKAKGNLLLRVSVWTWNFGLRPGSIRTLCYQPRLASFLLASFRRLLVPLFSYSPSFCCTTNGASHDVLIL